MVVVKLLSKLLNPLTRSDRKSRRCRRTSKLRSFKSSENYCEEVEGYFINVPTEGKVEKVHKNNCTR